MKTTIIVLGDSVKNQVLGKAEISLKNDRGLLFIYQSVYNNALTPRSYYSEFAVAQYVLEQLYKESKFLGLSVKEVIDRVQPRIFDVIHELYRDGYFFFIAESWDEASAIVREAHERGLISR